MEIHDNEIKTVASNANIEITPHGTGKVVLDRIQIDDNTIQTTESNANLELIPNGTAVSFSNYCRLCTRVFI